MRKRFVMMLATGLGSGYLPCVPGTWGTLLAMLLYLLCFVVLSLSQWILVLSTVILFFLGVWVSGQAEKYLQARDPGQVVIDEFAGYGLTVLFFAPSWEIGVAGFIIFRIFDIIKPFPVRYFEKPSGGWGVMLDDIAAGVYAAGAMALLRWGGIV